MLNSKKRAVRLHPEFLDLVRARELGISAIASQSILNAVDDDMLLVKSVKRRLAVAPPTKAEPAKVTLTMDSRVQNYLSNLARRIDLSEEETIRLSMEAYIYRL